MAFYLACLKVLAVVGLTLSAEGSVKPGCPTPNKDIICVWYNDQCKNDDTNCSEGEICCEDNCGTFCTKPADKPGICPPNPPNTFGPCVEECTGDASCPGDQKCCSNGCGHVCKTPIGKGKPPSRLERSLRGICEVGPPLQGIYCGRGGQECPKDFTCNIAPDDTYAVCCRTKICDVGTPIKGIYCGRGGQECPKDFTCNIAPDDTYAVCCRTNICGVGTPLEGYNCGRGGQECPKGYTCNIAPDDTYAVCCRGALKG